jgi:MinD-like ATPase involved in chromosome partitioning or flagellar assembly
MTSGASMPSGGQVRLVLGVSRTRMLPLRLAYEGHERVRVIASCASAREVVSAFTDDEADGAIVDEDLHGLNRSCLALFSERRWPLVLLSRQPEAARWQGLAGPVLSPESDPIDMLLALRRALQGEYAPRPPNQSLKAAVSRTSPVAPPARQPGWPRVIVFWSGRGAPGKTTLALNCLALAGAVEPTVLVELDTVAASLAAYLDDGRQGRPRRARSTLLELAGARLRTAEEWDQALSGILQPLGSFSPHARLLCGIAHPEQRAKLTDPAVFVDSLLTELRRRFSRVFIDVGSDPLAGESTEARIGSTALRLADRILVVATPEPASVHRTCMAVGEAGDRLDRAGVSLVINRVDPKRNGDVTWISNAVGLPIVAVLPADDRAQQRALAAAVPVVRDPDSRLRRGVTELLEQLGTPSVAVAENFPPAPRPPVRHPLWDHLRSAVTFRPSTFGGVR